MEVHQTRTAIGEDGRLRLEVPCHLPAGTIDVIVIVAPVSPAKEVRFRDYVGVGKEIWEGIDAQEYVNVLRDGGDLQEFLDRCQREGKK